jgi:hypothetical protein
VTDFVLVAAKDAEGKTCVFKFSAGVITGTCSSAKTAKGPALSLVKDQAKCVTGESTQLAAAEVGIESDISHLNYVAD